MRGALVCTWTAAVSGTHLLVPDACVDVLWIRGVGMRVCGPETAAWTFRLPPGTEAVGVRFRPGAAPAALACSAAEMQNIRIGLDDVLGAAPARALTDRIENAATDAQRIGHFEAAIRAWCEDRPIDPWAAPLTRALGTPGQSIRALADDVHVSERALQRRCHHLFGYGPTTLRSLLRLQRFMALARADSQARLADLAHRAGYADQAHLSRESRRIAAMTPTDLLASEAPDWHGGLPLLDVGFVQEPRPRIPQYSTRRQLPTDDATGEHIDHECPHRPIRRT
ncbi:AraC family transcriptional regulator [Rhodococcus rhodnii LMG 5362]|uniref:AraC family transcriptional regulator n=1 Tax=Rhodococcus rhodnii LMG 5362 TaxID=1273125 RepID=R7WQF2_9NOCA|nr:AraC family transcriptional regulator [Rhodococcus rhodnii LMG 5362]